MSRHEPLLLALFLLAPALAGAQPTRETMDVLSLSASASIEVTRDVLNITFSTMREGPDPTQVQAQLKQALDAALSEARKAARPGQVDVSTGNFSLYPRQPPKGGASVWQGTAELIVQGRDAPAIAALVGRIQTMSVARVNYSLSREAREKVHEEVSAAAIAAFRTRALAYTKQFGFSDFTLREVQVQGDEPPNMPMPMYRARVSASSADEALPVEAGKATVNATVSGSVQMTK
jgi:predicted secreted protein